MFERLMTVLAPKAIAASTASLSDDEPGRKPAPTMIFLAVLIFLPGLTMIPSRAAAPKMPLTSSALSLVAPIPMRSRLLLVMVELTVLAARWYVRAALPPPQIITTRLPRLVYSRMAWRNFLRKSRSIPSGVISEPPTDMTMVVGALVIPE